MEISRTCFHTASGKKKYSKDPNYQVLWSIARWNRISPHQLNSRGLFYELYHNDMQKTHVFILVHALMKCEAADFTPDRAVVSIYPPQSTTGELSMLSGILCISGSSYFHHQVPPRKVCDQTKTNPDTLIEFCTSARDEFSNFYHKPNFKSNNFDFRKRITLLQSAMSIISNQFPLADDSC